MPVAKIVPQIPKPIHNIVSPVKVNFCIFLNSILLVFFICNNIPIMPINTKNAPKGVMHIDSANSMRTIISSTIFFSDLVTWLVKITRCEKSSANTETDTGNS